MLTRRDWLRTAAALPLCGYASSPSRAADPPAPRLGIVGHAYNLHFNAARSNHPAVPFRDPLTFLEYCHKLGAGGIQVGLGTRPEDAAKLRARAETLGMFVEGQAGLPRQPGDVERFDVAVRTAKEAGADVIRVVALSGRRYETFDTDAAFRQFAAQARRSLELAAPVVAKHRVRLAVENHKDWRVPDLLEELRRLDNEWVGVCVDFGNSIALLEDPDEMLAAYASRTFSAHIKDMAVQEYPDGFLLSEVPFGDGFLDLPRMVAALRAAAPKVRFTLEMITRDPLKVPCLTPKYWATFGSVPGRDLARTLRTVRAKASKAPLPTVAGLSLEDKLKREDDNNRKCLRYARGRLGL